MADRAAGTFGDDSDWEELFAEYDPRIRRYLLRNFGERVASEIDLIMAEVWFSLWEDREMIRTEGFLFVRARLVAMTTMNRKTREERIRRTLVETSVDPDDAEFDRILIRHVIRKLPPYEQGLVELRFFEGLNCESIAARYGTKEYQIRYQLKKITRRLKCLLQDAQEYLDPCDLAEQSA